MPNFNRIKTIDMKSWLNWLIVRPWPFWALAVVTVLVALGGEWRVAEGGPGFNKIAGASLQALGALLVLISLNGNVGLFAGRTIVKEGMKWICDYPKKRQLILTPVSGSFQANYSIGGAIKVKPTELDARVAELEYLVDELRNIIFTQRRDLAEEIDSARCEATRANSRTSTALLRLEEKLIDSAVGGLKIPIFGIGLALIGSVLSVFS
jgi:hypothetical protein